MTVPRCSDPGTWTVTNVQLADATYVPGTSAGNFAQLTTEQVAAKGFATTLQVQAHDTTPPRFTTPATVPHAGPLVVTFTEPTLWSSVNGPLVEDSGLAAQPGVWTCKNASDAAVGCADDDADVTVASFQPTADLIVGHRYFVAASGHGIFDTTGNGPSEWSTSFLAS